MSSRQPTVHLPAALLAPLGDETKIVSWIAEITQAPAETVRQRLRDEFAEPGVNVVRAFRAAGLTPYCWSEGLRDFYSATDAFLYELVIWNLNRRKRRIRRWVGRHLVRRVGENLRILCIGDGLGFDAAYLAQAGHRVTYFEFPGYSEAFARRVFAECAPDIAVITDPGAIPSAHFDAVLCLDVLEHDPDPPAFAVRLADYLRPDGCLVVHAPFFMIHPSTPTHLKANRRYSGSLALYRRAGLHLLHGEPRWDPLLLQKRDRPFPLRHRLSWRILGLRFAGLVLSLGRLSTLPFAWVNHYRGQKSDWFPG